MDFDAIRPLLAGPAHDAEARARHIIELLRRDEATDPLSAEELYALALASNWLHDWESSRRHALRALALAPEWEDLLVAMPTFLWNGHAWPGIFALIDRYRAGGIGPPAFWHLMAAEFALHAAYDPWWWVEERRLIITDEAMWARAAAELRAALAIDPRLNRRPPPYRWTADWDERYAPLAADQRHRDLFPAREEA